MSDGISDESRARELRAGNMHPNADEIATAKRVLADAAYLCVHVEPEATWAVGEMREIAGWGVAITVRDIQDAHDQIVAIKRAYDPTLKV